MTTETTQDRMALYDLACDFAVHVEPGKALICILDPDGYKTVMQVDQSMLDDATEEHVVLDELAEIMQFRREAKAARADD